MAGDTFTQLPSHTHTGSRTEAVFAAEGRKPCAPLPVFFDLPALDRLFPRGFNPASLHAAASAAVRDGGLLAGFAVAFLARCRAVGACGDGAILWVTDTMARGESGALHGPGCAALGLDPGRLLLVDAHRPADVLWAMEEGLSGGVAAVVGELRGDPRALDLTASRRLALRSERSGVPALLLSNGGGAGPSAARSRWRIAPAPGRGTSGGIVPEASGTARGSASADPHFCATNFQPDVPTRTDTSANKVMSAASVLPGLPVWRLALVRNRDGRTGEALAGFDPRHAAFFTPDTVIARGARDGAVSNLGAADAGRESTHASPSEAVGTVVLPFPPRQLQVPNCRAVREILP